MLDALALAQPVKDMSLGWLPALIMEPIGEGLVVVREQLADPERRPSADRLEKRRGRPGILVRFNLHAHPARSAINGHD